MCEKKIFINGNWVDKNYIKENIEEALENSWVNGSVDPKDDHKHCMICWISMLPRVYVYCNKHKNAWLCECCYLNYIIPKKSLSDKISREDKIYLHGVWIFKHTVEEVIKEAHSLDWETSILPSIDNISKVSPSKSWLGEILKPEKKELPEKEELKCMICWLEFVLGNSAYYSEETEKWLCEHCYTNLIL